MVSRFILQIDANYFRRLEETISRKKYVDFEGQVGQFKRKDIYQNSVTAEVAQTLAY
jgi:hypothetical protein